MNNGLNEEKSFLIMSLWDSWAWLHHHSWGAMVLVSQTPFQQSLAGTLPLTSGQVLIKGETTLWSGKTGQYLSWVFQDPKMGTYSSYDSSGREFPLQNSEEKRLKPCLPVPKTSLGVLSQIGNGLEKHVDNGRIPIWWTTSSSEPVDGYPEASWTCS